jgi:hypothetical protein
MSTRDDRTQRDRATHASQAPPYDPQLRILGELEAEFGRELQGLASKGSPARRTQRQRMQRLRLPARVTRRALVLVALLSLVGASALAGRSVLEGSHEPASGPVLLSSGESGSERWQFEAYPHAGSVCYALFVAETVSSACGTAPDKSGLRAASAVGSNVRFVAGLAGAGVAQVSLRVGRHTLTVSTHPPPARAAAARSVKPFLAPRWFLAMLPGEPATRTAAARLTPRDGAGRSLGPTVLDCSLGGASLACRRAAAHIAGNSSD